MPTDEYVPTKTPMISTKLKPRRPDPPQIYITVNTSSVVTDVNIVREIVWLMLALMIPDDSVANCEPRQRDQGLATAPNKRAARLRLALSRRILTTLFRRYWQIVP